MNSDGMSIDEAFGLIMNIVKAEAMFAAFQRMLAEEGGIGLWEVLEEAQRTKPDDLPMSIPADMPDIEKHFHIIVYVAARHMMKSSEEDYENSEIKKEVGEYIQSKIASISEGGKIRELTDEEIDEMGDVIANAEVKHGERLAAFTENGCVGLLPDEIQPRLRYINDRVNARRRLAGLNTDQEKDEPDIPDHLSDNLKDVIKGLHRDFTTAD